MQKISIKDAKDFVGQQVLIQGWVYNFRSSGKLSFLQIRDGSGFIQAVVFQGNARPETWAVCEKMEMESSVEISGSISKHPKMDNVFELQANEVKVIQLAHDYPISKKEHGPDFLLDNRHLWLRSKRQWAILRVRNTIINATYEYFNNNGFIKVDAPILTPTSCEDTTELFETKYFDSKAYLTQSGQLYIEAAIFSVGKCFDFGPVFRAEKSKTRRHLTEFWMMDAEMAFADQKENMRVQEELVSFIVKKVLENNLAELEILERNIEPLKKVVAPFYHLTHKEAVAKLKELGSDILEDDDLGGDDETILTQAYDKPIFIENYPAKVKAFYMKRDPNDPTRVLCADLLAPEGYGEVIGGSQREDDYNTLLERIKEKNLAVESFQWYLDLRKYGSVPHSGFGYGLERLTTWICGIKHVRETIPFPRTISRLNP